MRIELTQYGLQAWSGALRTETPREAPLWEQKGYASPQEALADASRIMTWLETLHCPD